MFNLVYATLIGTMIATSGISMAKEQQRQELLTAQHKQELLFKQQQQDMFADMYFDMSELENSLMNDYNLKCHILSKTTDKKQKALLNKEISDLKKEIIKAKEMRIRVYNANKSMERLNASIIATLNSDLILSTVGEKLQSK